MEDGKTENAPIRPLWHSITAGCILFIVALCFVLGIMSYFSFRRSLYQRYEAFITDIIRYVDKKIDDDDLAECTRTLQKSEEYDDLVRFMDDIKEDFDIHYLYILVPLREDGKGKIMSVVSAENYYDRYVDTEGNLYLGWVSDDEYDDETVDRLFYIMNQHEIVFHVEATEWGTDYTGALPLYDSSENAYALLCVDVDISEVQKLIRSRTFITFILIILLGFLFTFIFLLWIRHNVTTPIMLLEKGVVGFAKKSHGQRSISELTFEPPEINAKNEVSSLASAVNQMAADMRDYVENIVKAEIDAEMMRQRANQLSELANKDSLTGIRNKTAYDNEIKKLEADLKSKRIDSFGIAMIDLNYLKKLNDTYGHDKGNLAIKKLCFLVCTIFEHSPVFRIGGDEFVVILKNRDLLDVNGLVLLFRKTIESISCDDTLPPWEKVSAAIGVAFYDPKIDVGTSSVFKRADQAMYESKKAMHANRVV
ncbi:MAG: GGDEF domain-containing protein [Treponema sp.]|nr:GGDEF domain-containing protein [Treponema sp.]